jgi:pilus assembly protein Flp/PilA
MNNLLLRTYVWAKIWREDDGQDLIEYALVAALICFAAVASMGTLAESINSAFIKVGSKLDSSMKG